MHKRNHQNITLVLKGPLALFTDPLNRLSGPKISYSVPTYAALKGIMNRFYSRPSIYWVIDECRVMNRIYYEAISRSDPYKNGVGERYVYQYLSDVEYVVKAHYEINKYFPEINRTYTFREYNSDIQLQLHGGGERDMFFGCRECQALITELDVENALGYYGDSGIVDLGVMFHSFVQPQDDQYIYAKLWDAKMENGVIRFPRARECPHERKLFRCMPKSSIEFEYPLYTGGIIDEPQFIPVQSHRIPKKNWFSK